MYSVKELFRQHGLKLELELLAGDEGLCRIVEIPEIQRPGLSLAGYLKAHVPKRVLLFGRVEIEYLAELSKELSLARLEAILTEKTPAVIVTHGARPPEVLFQVCKEEKIPLFVTRMSSMNLMGKFLSLLAHEYAPSISCHGSFVEVFGNGILIQGDSSVGKSEAALGLVERGHRFVADDLVQVHLREGRYLEGGGLELSRHLMEIRGIGIINIAHLYGPACILEKKSLDIVVKLEVWDDTQFYDRVGTAENKMEILGIDVPYHVLPLKPGRDVVLLLETIALNHNQRKMGYHSAKEFNAKLLTEIARKGIYGL